MNKSTNDKNSTNISLRIPHVVCCALCNDELTETEINTNLQMGAPESDAICEKCWQRLNQENYEQYNP